MKNVQIGEILLDYSYITREQLNEALKYQKSQAIPRRLGEILVELGYITEMQQAEALGVIMKLDVIDLEAYPIDQGAVEKIPKQIAVKYTVLAVSREGNCLTVAVWDPMDLYAVEDIRLVTNMELHLVLTTKTKLHNAIEIHYAELDARSAALRADRGLGLEKRVLEDMIITAGDDQAPVVHLLNSLLIKGYNTNVSDIHIEPYEKEMVIRMRRDGMLLPFMTLPVSVHPGLVARTKILARMDIAEKRRPQDGHFKIRLENQELNVRVSFVPTVYGEKGVLRFLTTSSPIDRSEAFGMSKANFSKMRELLKISHGIIYFTGPTGSGKTTTLYMVLQYMSRFPVNIVTIEDPVERSIPRISQMQVNELAGVTFESGLRSLLRQDPDIIMIGETRDLETAVIAARAAITGHLVFSTLHTNDAVASITRLKDMGLDAYIIADSITGIVAQRLIRKVCPYCASVYEAHPEERKLLYGDSPHQPPVRIRRGLGCHMCDHTGYRGRIAVHEILPVDHVLRRMIAQEKSQDEIRDYVREVVRLPDVGDEIRRLVLSGITSVEELERVSNDMGRTSGARPAGKAEYPVSR